MPNPSIRRPEGAPLSGRLWDLLAQAEECLYDIGADGTTELIVHTGSYDLDRRLDIFTSTDAELVYLGQLGSTRLGDISGNDAGEFFTHNNDGGGYAIYRHVFADGAFQSEVGASVSFKEFDEVGDAPLRTYINEKGTRYLRASDLDSDALLADIAGGGSCYE